MPFFAPEAIHFARADGTRDAMIYRVELPSVTYDGQVRVTGRRHATDGTEVWIAAELNELAARNGYEVICGRLYSPLDLTD